jgi:Dyp-type peroxidase family
MKVAGMARTQSITDSTTNTSSGQSVVEGALPSTESTGKKAPTEDLLEVNDIQGNILAGFNKDFQTFLFLKINDRNIVKDWLSAITTRISTVAEVHSFNNIFRALRARRKGEDPRGMVATWLNIAFTSAGIQALTSEEEMGKFQDTPFRLGMHERAGLLGDPLDANGQPANWVIGSAANIPDILLIIASDDPAQLDAKIGRVKESIEALPKPLGDSSAKHALEILYEQRGRTRADKPGHEHFGFKDGVSQPGIRGRISKEAKSFLTERLIDTQEARALLFGRPGQPLIWPGQFVFGYKRQQAQDPLRPDKALTPSPSWARNGSYLVVRRLVQDVPGFWKFVTAEAAELNQKSGFSGMTAERLATLLVGRWPSGAPLMRAPWVDNPALAEDRFANNHFRYVDPTEPIALIPTLNYPGDNFPQASGDNLGVICPHAAHIRKANPRDMATDTGGANDSLTRLLLRRGIPFGKQIQDPLHPTDEELAQERGLMFLSYQASIKEQFEFLANHWANIENQPQAGGHDPIIGQDPTALNRSRKITLIAATGETVDIALPIEWVIPTGGGYFFAPSISAIKTVLGAKD